MKKRSEVVESSENIVWHGLEGAGPVSRDGRVLDSTSSPEGARPVFLLLSATAVACS